MLYQFKQHKRKSYTVVDNTFINDNNLSWKAKGILLYLFSRPDDWQVYIKDLINKAADGEKALRSGLKELEKFGYLTRFVERDEKGRFTKTIYQVFEVPEENPFFIQSKQQIEQTTKNTGSHPPQNGKMDKTEQNHPLCQKRQVDNRHIDKEALLNTKYTKTRNKLNTLSTSKRERKPFTSFKKFKEFLIKNYAGVFKTSFKKESNLGYLPDTIFELKENGYLYNSVSEKYVDSQEAFKIWNYLYQQQEAVMQRLSN